MSYKNKILSTGSTFSRTLEERFSDETYVKDYHVVSDGFDVGRTDNTAAIQAAVDATIEGGTLIFPRGAYYCASGIKINKSIHIRGAGGYVQDGWNGVGAGFGAYTYWHSPKAAGTILITDMVSGQFIDSSYTSTPHVINRLILDSLIFIGQASGTQTTIGVRLGNDPNGGPDAQNASFYDRIFCNFSKGTQWNFVEGSQMINCSFFSCDRGGEFNVSTNANTFVNINCHQCNSYGLYFYGALNNIVAGGSVQSCGAGATGIYIGPNCNNSKISGLYFENSLPNYSIFIDSNGCTVDSCSFTYPGTDDVKIAGQQCLLFNGTGTNSNLIITGSNTLVFGPWAGTVTDSSNTSSYFNGGSGGNNGICIPIGNKLFLAGNFTGVNWIGRNTNTGDTEISTATGTTKFVVGGSKSQVKCGGFSPVYFTKSSAYTLVSWLDYFIAGNATSAPFAVTLPAATGIDGNIYVVKKIDSSTNAVTLTAAGSDKIDGSGTYPLSAQYKYVAVQSDGSSNWWIVGQN